MDNNCAKWLDNSCEGKMWLADLKSNAILKNQLNINYIMII